MRILYMGTPDFAVAPLQKILDDGHTVCAVFTQPDKPKGRHFTLTPPPVKVLAQKYNIPVFQPETFKNNEEAYQTIYKMAPECIVVAAYGRLLPQRILDIPPLGCINIHGSLLPKYRGAAPIQWAVINGDKETGVTTMYMAKGLDTGDILLKESMPIGSLTSGELHDRLSLLGADLILKTLHALKDGTAQRHPQDESLATYAPMITKETGRIRFDQTAEAIACLIRGVSPWPGAFFEFGGKKVKVRQAMPVEGDFSQPGMLMDTKKLIVACGNHTGIELLEVVPEGSKPMTGSQFLMGRRLEKGILFHVEDEK